MRDYDGVGAGSWWGAQQVDDAVWGCRGWRKKAQMLRFWMGCLRGTQNRWPGENQAKVSVGQANCHIPCGRSLG